MMGPPPLPKAHLHLGPMMLRTSSRLLLALGLTLAFVLVEALAGLFANSLALLTDAAHNLTDVIALGLSWYAVRLTMQPSNSHRTYGYHRAGILVASINSTTLVIVALGVLYEAYRRLIAPPEVKSQVLIIVGLMAVGVNLLTAWLVRRGAKTDLNLRSAFVHLMADVASTAGAVIAGVIIFFTKANWLDPLTGALIGIAIIYSAWGILQRTIEILLESTPRDIDMQALVGDLMRIKGVLGVHDLHVWSLSQNLRTMSAHILTEDIPLSAGSRIQSDVNEMLSRQYNIAHATLQLECVGCDPDALYCDIDGVVRAPQES